MKFNLIMNDLNVMQNIVTLIVMPGIYIRKKFLKNVENMK